MKKVKRYVFLALLCAPITLLSTGCDALYQIANSAGSQANDPSPLEIGNGLKEALNKGLTAAVGKLSATDGFWGDAAVKILFPKEADFAATKLRQIGAGKLVDDFEKLLNRAAEDAAKEATSIFVNAITSMTFADVKNILFGGSTAATDYFKGKTSDALYNAFSPKIKGSLDKVGAAKAWTTITTTYNAIPLVNKKVETDIVRYATNKAMDGLFKKIADEEAQIRQNPVVRSTALLKKVFGYADRKKASSGTKVTKG
ncbi:MAG: DUF4197 domain-containing protein [Bacteroidia bacterium]